MANVKNILTLGHKTKIEEGVVGDVKHSMLSESQFQAIHGSTWVLMKGQDITGTTLASMLGITKLPDQRGKFLRSAVIVADKTTTSVNVSTDSITVTGHEYSTGFKVRVSGSLPSGLATNTTYYVIVIDANTIKFASTYANAITGTAVDITSSILNMTITQWEDPESASRIAHQGQALGSYQEDAMQGHKHAISDPGHAHTLALGGVVGNSNAIMGNGDGIVKTTSTVATGVTVQNPSTDAVNGTPRTGQETRPTNLIYNTFVKVN